MVKVSVIVPVYNANKYLQRSICSLMEQTLDDVEFIIIDDGSQDGSADIIREIVNTYPARINQVNLIVRENRGVAATRAQGVDLATGEYIIHFDSDDWARLDMLELMYEKAKQDNADIVVCNYFDVFKDTRVEVWQDVPEKGTDCVSNLLLEHIGNANWNKLVRRAVFTSNAINFVSGLDMGEDFLVSLRLFLVADKVSHIPVPLYFYNKDNESALTKNYTEKLLEDISKVACHASTIIDECALSEQHEFAINKFKLNVRSLFIVYSNGDAEIAKKGLNLFKETDFLVKKFVGPKFLIFSYYLNLFGMIRFYNVFYKIRGFVKSLY